MYEKFEEQKVDSTVYLECFWLDYGIRFGQVAYLEKFGTGGRSICLSWRSSQIAVPVHGNNWATYEGEEDRVGEKGRGS